VHAWVEAAPIAAKPAPPRRREIRCIKTRLQSIAALRINESFTSWPLSPIYPSFRAALSLAPDLAQRVGSPQYDGQKMTPFGVSREGCGGARQLCTFRQGRLV
jgi:hypothetical protein